MRISHIVKSGHLLYFKQYFVSICRQRIEQDRETHHTSFWTHKASFAMLSLQSFRALEARLSLSPFRARGTLGAKRSRQSLHKESK